MGGAGSGRKKRAKPANPESALESIVGQAFCHELAEVREDATRSLGNVGMARAFADPKLEEQLEPIFGRLRSSLQEVQAAADEAQDAGRCRVFAQGTSAIESVRGAFAPGLEEECDEATQGFTTGYDANLKILRIQRDRNPTPELTRMVDQFAEQRQRAIDDYRRRCLELGHLPEVQLPVPFGQELARPMEFNLQKATKENLARYMVAWYDRMIPDEAKAMEEYGQFSALLEEGARKFMDDPAFATFLHDTATNLGQITIDETKHHSVFVRLRTDTQAFLSSPGTYGAGIGEQVGGTAGGLAAGAAVSALGLPELAPLAAPVGAAAGAQAGRYVETTAVPAAAGAIGRYTRRSMYGDIVEYGAAFAPSNREAAVELAETYQAAGQPSFVFFDPVKDRWIVEVGEPTQTERDLIGKDRVRVVHPGTQPPRDPTRRYFLMYTSEGEREGFGAIRPTALDAVIEMDRPEYGAILLHRAARQAPCTCATTPEGKELCTRPGAIGMLSQAQVAQNCSEIIHSADGRLERARALRVAQSICGTQVTASQYPDPGERMAARISCLRTVLPTVK